MKPIKIGEVSIPFDDYLTQGTGILGIRGSGKTYTAKGIAEQILDAKVPIVVFDAIGVWRYLKTAGDGHGYKVVVAGGHQPDLPLNPASAPQIIRAAIRENIPLIVDLYDTKLSKADWRKIVQESFRILLYENTGLRHIFLEEAAEYCPQKVMDGATFAEVEKLVRMGGNKSLGITLINQRSQELNKSVLELCDNLVMMRQKGFNAIAYAEKWAERLSPDQAQDIGKRLPNMKAGECWVFTDATEAPTFTRSKTINSFHPDRKRPEHPKNSVVADPTDFVEKMSAKLATVLEEAKANDPAELKRTIAELKRKLADSEKNKTVETKEVSVFGR
jgi:DNA helicase HerA-like ATPase